MTITISQDGQRPAGYAWITVQAAAPADVRFQIHRTHGSKPCLGPAGWQASPADLSPQTVRYGEQGAELLVGPDVVNHVPEYEQIRVVLPQIGFDEEAVWPPIPHLHRGRGLTGLTDRGDEAARDGGRGIEATISTARIETPEPDPAAAPPPPEPQPKPTVPPAPLAPETAAAPHSKRGLLTAVLVVLLIAATALVYLRQSGRLTAFGTGEAEGFSLAALPPTATPALPQPSDADSWRAAMLDPNATAESLHALGVSLSERNPPNWEFAFEAMTRAGDKGHPQARLFLAEAYDPSLERWRTILRDHPSATIAMRHYRDAQAVNNAAATAGATRLCAWLATRQRIATDDERRAIELYCS